MMSSTRYWCEDELTLAACHRENDSSCGYLINYLWGSWGPIEPKAWLLTIINSLSFFFNSIWHWWLLKLSSCFFDVVTSVCVIISVNFVIFIKILTPFKNSGVFQINNVLWVQLLKSVLNACFTLPKYLSHASRCRTHTLIDSFCLSL